MSKHKLMLDILKDTRDYYAEDPDNRRSISEDGECLYTWGDSHCAVGRYLKEEYQVENWKNNNESVNELCDASPETWDIDWALREEAQGLNPDFWRDLQDFHDGGSHWLCETKSPIKLSDRGKQYYVGVEDKIVGGRYDD